MLFLWLIKSPDIVGNGLDNWSSTSDLEWSGKRVFITNWNRWPHDGQKVLQGPRKSWWLLFCNWIYGRRSYLYPLLTPLLAWFPCSQSVSEGFLEIDYLWCDSSPCLCISHTVWPPQCTWWWAWMPISTCNPILIPPASNTFHFCHHPQPHHSQPYHAQTIIYQPSFVINGNSQYQAYSTIILIFPIFSRLPSPICPPLNSVKWSSPQNNSCHRRYSPIRNLSSTMHIFRNEVNRLVDDNEARREYEAEFGVPGISSSSAPPPMIFHLQLQNQIQRDRICLPPRILSWEWFQDKLRIYCCLWLVIYPKMTHHMAKHDSWHSQWRHLENDYWWIPPCSFIWLIHFSHMTYPIAFLASFFPSLQTTFYF